MLRARHCLCGELGGSGADLAHFWTLDGAPAELAATGALSV